MRTISRLLQRCFSIDVLSCPACGGRMRLVALVTDPKSTRRFLRGLGGRKERIAWSTNGSREALDAWLLLRGDEPGPLFMPVTKGGSIVRHRMTDGAIAELVHRLARKSRIPAFSPHDCRRTWIGDLLQAGADIATVGALAGHASVTTTARYDRRTDQTRKRAAELLHVPFVGRGDK